MESDTIPFEMGYTFDLSTAFMYFQKALHIRLEKGDRELIQSTEHCIQYCLGKDHKN